MSTAASPSTIAWWSFAIIPTLAVLEPGHEQELPQRALAASGVGEDGVGEGWKVGRLTGSSAP